MNPTRRAWPRPQWLLPVLAAVLLLAGDAVRGVVDRAAAIDFITTPTAEEATATRMVLDTSVLISDPDSIHAFPGADTVIPLVVVEELDPEVREDLGREPDRFRLRRRKGVGVVEAVLHRFEKPGCGEGLVHESGNSILQG